VSSRDFEAQVIRNKNASSFLSSNGTVFNVLSRSAADYEHNPITCLHLAFYDYTSVKSASEINGEWFPLFLRYFSRLFLSLFPLAFCPRLYSISLPSSFTCRKSTTWDRLLFFTSFGGEVKPSVPCRRFTACKITLQSMSEMLCRPNFPTPVSHLLRYQMALVAEPGWFEILLRQQVSHLLLKCTNLGYWTVLTAACAVGFGLVH
jgi:hypothetical protein